MIKSTLTLIVAATLLHPCISKGTEGSADDKPALTVVLLVNEQPEVIEELVHQYTALFDAFGKYDHPQYNDMAQVAFGLGFYPEMLEDGISREERLSSPYWKTLLAFLSEYEETDASYKALPKNEKRYLDSLTEYVLHLCGIAEMEHAKEA